MMQADARPQTDAYLTRRSQVSDAARADTTLVTINGGGLLLLLLLLLSPND